MDSGYRRFAVLYRHRDRMDIGEPEMVYCMAKSPAGAMARVKHRPELKGKVWVFHAYESPECPQRVPPPVPALAAVVTPSLF